MQVRVDRWQRQILKAVAGVLASVWLAIRAVAMHEREEVWPTCWLTNFCNRVPNPRCHITSPPHGVDQVQHQFAFLIVDPEVLASLSS